MVAVAVAKNKPQFTAKRQTADMHKTGITMATRPKYQHGLLTDRLMVGLTHLESDLPFLLSACLSILFSNLLDLTAN